jgi:hypothetical protein
LESLIQNEEEKVELEFQKLKDISRPSSVDSLIGNLPGNLDHNIINGDSPSRNKVDVDQEKMTEENKEDLEE